MQEVYSNKNASRLHAGDCIVAGASTAPLFWQDNERYNANGVPITAAGLPCRSRRVQAARSPGSHWPGWSKVRGLVATLALTLSPTQIPNS